MMEAMIVQSVIAGLVGGVFAGIGAMATVKVELRWLRRDVDWLLDNKDRRKGHGEEA